MKIKEGYKARWLMDDAVSTTLLDSSGNGLNATTSSTLDSSFNNKGSARKVSASSQGIYRTNVLSSYASFTISTMYKLNSINTASNTYTNAILGITTGGANGVFIAISPFREISFYYYNGSAHLVSGSGIFLNLNEWVHLSLTASNGVYKIYLNGVQIHAITLSHNVGLNFSTCYVNGTYNTYTYIYGSYDDIIIWEFTLSDIEIFNVYKYYFKEKRILLHSNNKIYSFDKQVDTWYETKMTSDTSPSPLIASASSVWSSTFPAWKAFNGTNISSEDCWVTVGGSITGWIQLDFGSPKYCNKIKLTSRSGSTANACPKDFTISASNDGLTFDVIATITGQINWALNETRMIKFDNARKYRIYRLTVISNDGYSSYSAIGQLQFGYKGNTIFDLPKCSQENFIEHGQNELLNLNEPIATKNYILQDDTIIENEQGLWIKQINKKPLSISFN